MKNLLPVLLICISSTFTFGQTSSLDWVKSLGNVNWWCDATTTDIDGNTYITGFFNDTVDFDPGPGVFNLISNGGSSLFIEKLDANGNFLWAKSIAVDTAPYTDKTITTDVTGNVYIAGTYDDTVDFDPGLGVFNLISNGSSSIFIEKLDVSGNFIWAKSIAGEYGSYSHKNLSADASGNVYFTGFYQDTIDIDPGNGVFNLISNGLHDVFILKLDIGGNFIWAKSIGGTDDDTSNNISIDMYGNVYVTGLYGDTVDFNPTPVVFNLSSSAQGSPPWSQFYALSKLDASGNFVWAKFIGDWGLYSDLGRFITTDAVGNIFLTGFESVLGIFVYIEKLDANGNILWHKKLAGEHARGESIAVDSSGNVYLTGKFKNNSAPLDFDPGPGVYTLNSNGGFDVYILELDSNGNFIGAKSIGGINAETGREISLDASGNLYITGLYSGTVDFDPDSGITNLTSNNLFNYNLFILKLSQSVLSVDESKIFENISIYPNPNSGVVNLNLDNLKGVTVKIFSTNGQLIYHQNNINDIVHQIELNKSTGIYIIEVSQPGRQNETQGGTHLYKLVKL
ncbi:MAG: hypothetical protein COB15_05075 [Flavobacteriales bacterium]|nr:MAG: hypothetical protein COB15_05075 [Flavobacteriales bacterium]